MATVKLSRHGQRDALTARIRLLVAATIVYNIIESAVALTAGTISSSTALIGFGIDSIIEVSSAAALAWQFAARDAGRRGAREHSALRITAISLFALSAYLVLEAGRAFTGGVEAQHSPAGITLAAVSLAVMPILSAAQRRAGRQLESASAVADSRQTLLCTYLSAALLIGLLTNSLLGWAWADPAAATVIAAIALKEGLNAWRGDSCCPTPIPDQALTDRTDHDECECC